MGRGLPQRDVRAGHVHPAAVRVGQVARLGPDTGCGQLRHRRLQAARIEATVLDGPQQRGLHGRHVLAVEHHAVAALGATQVVDLVLMLRRVGGVFQQAAAVVEEHAAIALLEQGEALVIQRQAAERIRVGAMRPTGGVVVLHAVAIRRQEHALCDQALHIGDMPRQFRRAHATDGFLLALPLHEVGEHRVAIAAASPCGVAGEGLEHPEPPCAVVLGHLSSRPAGFEEIEQCHYIFPSACVVCDLAAAVSAERAMWCAPWCTAVSPTLDCSSVTPRRSVMPAPGITSVP